MLDPAAVNVGHVRSSITTAIRGPFWSSGNPSPAASGHQHLEARNSSDRRNISRTAFSSPATRTSKPGIGVAGGWRVGRRGGEVIAARSA